MLGGCVYSSFIVLDEFREEKMNNIIFYLTCKYVRVNNFVFIDLNIKIYYFLYVLLYGYIQDKNTVSSYLI